MTSRSDRLYDIIVFGATSFVGDPLPAPSSATAPTVISPGPSPPNEAKLAALRATGADVARIVADAGDADAMAELAESTRLVISTVGPYAPTARSSSRWPPPVPIPST